MKNIILKFIAAMAVVVIFYYATHKNFSFFRGDILKVFLIKKFLCAKKNFLQENEKGKD